MINFSNLGFKQNLQTLGQDLDILLKAGGGFGNKYSNLKLQYKNEKCSVIM